MVEPSRKKKRYFAKKNTVNTAAVHHSGDVTVDDVNSSSSSAGGRVGVANNSASSSSNSSSSGTGNTNCGTILHPPTQHQHQRQRRPVFIVRINNRNSPSRRPSLSAATPQQQPVPSIVNTSEPRQHLDQQNNVHTDNLLLTHDPPEESTVDQEMSGGGGQVSGPSSSASNNALEGYSRKLVLDEERTLYFYPDGRTSPPLVPKIHWPQSYSYRDHLENTFFFNRRKRLICNWEEYMPSF